VTDRPPTEMSISDKRNRLRCKSDPAALLLNPDLPLLTILSAVGTGRLRYESKCNQLLLKNR